MSKADAIGIFSRLQEAEGAFDGKYYFEKSERESTRVAFYKIISDALNSRDMVLRMLIARIDYRSGLDERGYYFHVKKLDSPKMLRGVETDEDGNKTEVEIPSITEGMLSLIRLEQDQPSNVQRRGKALSTIEEVCSGEAEEKNIADASEFFDAHIQPARDEQDRKAQEKQDKEEQQKKNLLEALGKIDPNKVHQQTKQIEAERERTERERLEKLDEMKKDNKKPKKKSFEDSFVELATGALLTEEQRAQFDKEEAKRLGLDQKGQ